MGPSAYHAKLTKDQLVEDRGGVSVTFAGGNVFHVRVEGSDKPIAVRGVKAAWERSEAERHKLYSEYVPIPYEKPSELTLADSTETEGAQTGEGPAAPADNVDDDSNDEAENDPDDAPKADIPPADGADAGDEGDGGPVLEAGAPTQGEPVDHVSLEGGVFPITLVDVEAVTAALGEIQVRLPGFIGDPKLSRLAERVRATDGRCAPVFFTTTGARDDVRFYCGLETLGAAIHLGMERIAVVIVPAETATISQGPISAMTQAANAAVGSQDDDMVYRAYQ